MTNKRMKKIINETINFAYELWEYIHYSEIEDDFYISLMERTGMSEYELEQLLENELDDLISEWDEEDDYQDDGIYDEFDDGIDNYDVDNYDDLEDTQEGIEDEEDRIEDEFNGKYYR